jgi:hypothetical protein
MMMRALVVSISSLLLVGCSSSPASPDTLASDLRLEARADGPAPERPPDGRPDLGPDGPRVPAHWKTVPAASLEMQGHTLTLLKSGEVLIVGGHTQVAAKYTYLAKTYRYLPASDTIVEAGTLLAPRADHSATLLADGRVMITSGANDSGLYLVSTELFDPAKPAATAWSAGPPMPEARFGGSAILLPSGELMVSGGAKSNDSLDTVARLDPASGSWKTGATPLKEQRRFHASTLLPDGRVLLSGGQRGHPLDLLFLGSLELYDPKAGTSAMLPTSMKRLRAFHSATLLDDGRILFVGGYCGANDCGAAVDELLDLKADAIAPLTHPGKFPSTHVAAKLKDGRVLITGNAIGADHRVLAFTVSPLGWETLPDMPHPRDRAEGVTLSDGSVLIVGGVASSSPFTYAPEVERLFP